MGSFPEGLGEPDGGLLAKVADLAALGRPLKDAETPVMARVSGVLRVILSGSCHCQKRD